ncbi:MAG: replicative DNA helicase [Mycoplasmoidaceae bacterium]
MQNGIHKTIEELESILLSAILNSDKESETIFLTLTPSDFSVYNNKQIFAASIELRKEQKHFETLSLISFIDSNKDFQFDDYANYIMIISNKYTYDQGIKSYVEIIQNSSIIRRLKAFGKELQNVNMDVINSGEILWNLEKEFLNITNSRTSKNIENIANILLQFQQKIEITKGKSGLTGTPSGFYNLDKITNGFQPEDLIILAARPGIGKTAICLNFLLNSAKDLLSYNSQKTPDEKQRIVLMFSMEMGNLQLCERMLSMESSVDISVIKRGKWDSMQELSITQAISSLNSYPIYIDDSSSLSIMDIQSKLKQISNNKEVKLIIIDYLQLLKSDHAKNAQVNRQQEVSNISRTLKSLARQYKVPIIAISQLSRKIEERRSENKRPILSDLRESGAIEQDADIVSFLSYKEDNELEKSSTNWKDSVVVEYIIAKHRNGSTAIIDLLFEKPIGKYMEIFK